MRIEFLTQEDPLYLLPFFEEFAKNYIHNFEIVRISCSRPMGKRSRTKLFRELLWLFGPIGLVRLLAQVASDKVASRLPAKPTAQHFHSIAQLCRAHDIPYARVENPNSAEYMAGFRERKPDLLISISCPYILKKELLNSVPMGCLNIHHAPLPRYKGMMPTFWQMYHGEKKVGVTVHYMAEKIDEGKALLQDELTIMPGESLHDLIRRSKRHAAHCLARTLHSLSDCTQAARPLDQEAGTYFTFPTREQIREFRRRGLRTI